MHWILQVGVHTESGCSALLAALERSSIDCSAHAVVPRIGESVLSSDIAHVP